MLDEQGEWWGWENVTPKDLSAISATLLAGVSQWHHYRITRIETPRGRS